MKAKLTGFVIPALLGFIIGIVLLGPCSEVGAADNTSDITIKTAPVQVTGFGFSVKPFEEGAIAYSNRQYRLINTPESLHGCVFTQVGGGEIAQIEVVIGTQREVTIVTSKKEGDVALYGWTPIDSPGFHYTDANKNPLGAYRQTFDPGQTVTIPQLGWTGTMLVAPRINATLRQPEIDLSLAPGTVIDHSPASSKEYIGSPSITKWTDPTGRESYIASHDRFGPDVPAVTNVFRSDDRGASWTHLTDLPDQFWSTLFEHRGAMYMIGVSKEQGYPIIRRSNDGGRTWTSPTDQHNGLLRDDVRYHCSPQPVVVHNGRLWRAMEDTAGPSGWGHCFRALMMSVPVDADLLDADNWTFSDRLGRNPQWLDGEFGGWLEGNAVVTPEGNIVNLLRVDYRHCPEKAAIIRYDADGRRASFDPEADFINMPGACKKFTVRFDPRSGKYWTLANAIPRRHRNYNVERSRNTLVLMCSPDLRNWTVRSVILYQSDPVKHGYQYCDWQFDGDDLIAVVRTTHDDALGGAHNQHDANFMTFHRVESFRDITDNEPELDFGM